MQADFHRFKRRPFLVPLLMPLVFLAVAIAVALWLIDARNSTVIVAVRHGETSQLTTGKPSLSAAGQTRAQNLLAQLRQAKPGRGVDAIYVAEGEVNQQTAAPLAQQMGLAINVVPGGDWSNLPGKITRDHAGEVILVVADQDKLSALLSHYVSTDGYHLDALDYGSLFVIAKSKLSKAAVMRLQY